MKIDPKLKAKLKLKQNINEVDVLKNHHARA